MPSLKANKTTSSLLKKGFVLSNSHHHYYEFWHNDQLVSRTYSSHNNEDIHEGLISSMSKQCKMDKMFFIDFAKMHKIAE